MKLARALRHARHHKITMQNVIDLTKATFGELEDCANYKGDLYIQAQGDLFRLTF